MSTKAIRELIEDAGKWDDTRRYELTQKALAEVAAIEKAAGNLVEWFAMGDERPKFHLGAARGYDVLERIAKETQG